MYSLSNLEKNEILDGSLLSDAHMDFFHHLLRSSSYCNPQSSLYLRNIMIDSRSKIIKQQPRDEKLIQLLHSCDGYCQGIGQYCVNGHWVCCYYDAIKIYIFDSMNHKQLHICFRAYLQKLFPNLNEIPIQIPDVQNQINGADCGVFAIAFATSIFFGLNPPEITYDNSQSRLRFHLFKMFENRKLEHFPRRSIATLVLSDARKLVEVDSHSRSKSFSVVKDKVHQNVKSILKNRGISNDLKKESRVTFNDDSLKPLRNNSLLSTPSLRGSTNGPCISRDLNRGCSKLLSQVHKQNKNFLQNITSSKIQSPAILTVICKACCIVPP